MTKLFQNYKRAAVEFVKAEGNYPFLTKTARNTLIFQQESV